MQYLPSPRSIRHCLVVAVAISTLCFGSARPADDRPEKCTTGGTVGTVFEDLNENGLRDEGEPGIAGVAVSDQIHVVVTGPDGTYSLATRGRFGFIQLSVPSGFRANGEFWRRVDAEASTGAVDFPLIRRAPDGDLTFLHASDTHVSDESLHRTRRLHELVVELKPDLVLITGDLVANAPGVGEERARHDFELFLEAIGGFRVPVYTVPGNRDTFGVERHNSLVSPPHPLFDKEMYRHYLGPTYYSFNRGGVHFIALDSVVYHELWYHGHVDETQLEWLEEDLARVAAETPVVTFQHIPLVSSAEVLYGYRESLSSPSVIRIDGKARYRHTVANYKAVLAALKDHRFTLALGGHLHLGEKLTYEADGFETRFHIGAAVIGDTPASRAGMRMISGVTLYTVTGGEIDGGTFFPLDEPSDEDGSGMH